MFATVNGTGVVEAPVETVEMAQAPPCQEKPKRGGGPRTEEGKARSRLNALKHGLRSKTVLPEEFAAVVAEKAEGLVEDFKPANEQERWLVDQVALHMVRVDRAVELELAHNQRQIERAETCWYGDKFAAAEEVGRKLGKEPSRTMWTLRRTYHGSVWLTERWEMLARALEVHGRWDDDQRRLALDLLGTPMELREASPLLPPNASRDELLELVQEQLESLETERAESLDRLDQIEQGMAVMGYPSPDDRVLIRLQRYEASSRRALQWSLNELRRLQAGRGESPRRVDRRDLPHPDHLLQPAPRMPVAKAPEPVAPAPPVVVEAEVKPEPVAEILPPAAERPRGNRQQRKRLAHEALMAERRRLKLEARAKKQASSSSSPSS